MSIKQRSDTASDISYLLRFLKAKENFDLSIETKKKATVILMKANLKEGYGGAILYPSKRATYVALALSPSNNSSFPEYSIQMGKEKCCWQARIFLSWEDMQGLSLNERSLLTVRFYETLYEKLKNFACARGLRSLTLSIPLYEGCLPAYKQWPHLWEIRQDRLDFFQGLLVVNEKFFQKKPFGVFYPSLAPLDASPDQGEEAFGRGR